MSSLTIKRQQKKENIFRSVTYKDRNVRYAKDIVDELRRQNRTLLVIIMHLCTHTDTRLF